MGGLEIQLRLRDYLAAKFNNLKLTPNDVTKNARSMAKLFKEAGRLKNVLSANTEHFAQVIKYYLIIFRLYCKFVSLMYFSSKLFSL